MDSIRVGIVGAGYWGPNLIRNFSDLPQSRVLGVADLKEDRLKHIKANFPQVSVTQDYKDLLDMGLDAMVIATPPASHYKLAKECLEKGMHVLVEKPLTLYSNQAIELIELAEKKHRTLMVGHTFEYNPAVRALKSLIDSGELGQIYYLDAARLNLGLFQNGVNVLWDLAPHDISIIYYLLDQDPVSVNASGMPCVFQGLYDVVYINLVFPNNVLAHIHVSWLEPCKVRRLTVVGSSTMVVYNDIEPMEKIKIYDKGVEAPSYTTTFGEFQCAYRYGDIRIPNIKFTEPLRLECQDFLECISNSHKPVSSGEDGLRVIRVLEAAQRSLDNQGRVEYLA